VLLLLVANACADSRTPTGPTMPGTIGLPRTAPAPPPGSFTAVSRPARIYVFVSALQYPVQYWTIGSRYVLYDDGTFALQYLQPQGEYRGTYTETNAVITFRWDANQNVPAPWRPAVGTLKDDTLTVRYDLIMHHDDFEDAHYGRTQ
jgi:hypothetical protein